DFKKRVTQGLTLDLTYNTDFSHVEVDTQQINLTRFNLFFPEKRDFFLENTGLFDFGDILDTPGIRTVQDTQLFYSRRIGLSSAGAPLPLFGGVRLSGRTGAYSIGLLDIQQEKAEGSPSNNFTVLRVRRNFLGQSDVGAIFINRQGGKNGDFNRTYGIDANLYISQKLMINSYLAATESPGKPGNDLISKLSSKWDNGFWYTEMFFADIGENFNPEVGFVPRTGVRHYQFDAGLRPRPQGRGRIREIHPQLSLKYFTDRHNATLTKISQPGIELRFNDGSRFELSYRPQFERLQVPFEIRKDVIIDAGDYFFRDYNLEYSSDNTRLFSTSTRLTLGDFYDGRRTSTSFSGVLLVKPRLSTQISYQHNRVDVKGGRFRADLYGIRFNYSFNPRMFVDAFIQYNTSTNKTLTNLRFNLEHRPLSNITVVLTEDRLVKSGQDISRALIVKYTHMLQF
ncbi:MAG: hypothetical protein HY315_10380, partial [Acidobacteria bacterium]|nr:hypothetical protein [Acidobacteriota bacterium]